MRPPREFWTYARVLNCAGLVALVLFTLVVLIDVLLFTFRR